MSRPIYEKPEDVKREWEIAHLVGERWDAKTKKLPHRYTLDYDLLRGKKVHAGLEVKVRDKQFSTMMLSQHKMYGAQPYLEMQPPLPVLLVVEWPHGIHWRKMELDAETRLLWGGRTDRRDWQDEEPMLHWPVKSFKFLAPCGSMPEAPVDYDLLDRIMEWAPGTAAALSPIRQSA